MISRSGGQGFFAAHYDWIVLGVGVLAIVAGGAFFASTLGDDADEMTAAEVQRVKRMKPQELGVKDTDMSSMQSATRAAKSPVTVAEVPEKSGSFLASDRRVICKGKDCGKVIPGSVKACPFCKTELEEAKPVVLDADGDGLPDEYERKVGLNPADASDAAKDADSDGFTNLEEFTAKTDPNNAKDHPDYLDSVRIQLPLKQTYLPFVFTAANKVPGGWKCDFFDASQKDDYGRKGLVMRAKIGEEIGVAEKKPTGYVFKDFAKKEAKREKKGMKGMFVTVDVSEVTVERKGDGKKVVLVLSSKRGKPEPVDVQVEFNYERGETKTFEAVKGTEIDLNGTKYRIAEITSVNKGAKVVFENVLTGKRRTLEALEQ